MNPIIFKSILEKTTYTLSSISIPEKESLLRKAIRKLQNKPREIHNFVNNVSFDKIKIRVFDEVDMNEWMNRTCALGSIDYRKEIQATDKDGITYLFKGCFPIKWVPETREATFNIDFYEIITLKETK